MSELLRVMFELFCAETDNLIRLISETSVTVTEAQARKLRHRRKYYRMMARRARG